MPSTSRQRFKLLRQPRRRFLLPRLQFPTRSNTAPISSFPHSLLRSHHISPSSVPPSSSDTPRSLRFDSHSPRETTPRPRCVFPRLKSSRLLSTSSTSPRSQGRRFATVVASRCDVTRASRLCRYRDDIDGRVDFYAQDGRGRETSRTIANERPAEAVLDHRFGAIVRRRRQRFANAFLQAEK